MADVFLATAGDPRKRTAMKRGFPEHVSGLHPLSKNEVFDDVESLYAQVAGADTTVRYGRSSALKRRKKSTHADDSSSGDEKQPTTQTQA
jgi:hypothetical protein